MSRDQPRLLQTRRLDRLDAVSCLVQVECRHAFERRDDQPADERIVVDDQDRAVAHPIDLPIASIVSSLTVR